MHGTCIKIVESVLKMMNVLVILLTMSNVRDVCYTVTVSNEHNVGNTVAASDEHNVGNAVTV